MSTDSELDSTASDELQGRLGSGWMVRVYQRASSTMDEARAMLPFADGLAGCVLAKTQTAGRGRFGRRWETLGAGLYATYIFQTDRSPIAPGYALAVGVVVAEMLSIYGDNFLLKWPNDILSRGGLKVGGILVETACAQGQWYVLTGIGVNLETMPASAEQDLGAVSVEEATGTRLAADTLCIDLAPYLRAAFAEFEKDGFKIFRTRWLEHSWQRGVEITVETERDILNGRYEGVGEDGALLMSCEQRVISIASGTVRLKMCLASH